MARITEIEKENNTIYRIERYSNGNFMSKQEMVECKDGKYESKDGIKYNVLDSGEYILYNFDGEPIFHRNKKITDEVLKKLCEMFNAKVYGNNTDDVEYDEDKVAIYRADNGKQGILTYLNSNKNYFVYHFPVCDTPLDYSWIGTKDFEMFIDRFGFYSYGGFYCDPFKEYSLFLQGKENKWKICEEILFTRPHRFVDEDKIDEDVDNFVIPW